MAKPAVTSRGNYSSTGNNTSHNNSGNVNSNSSSGNTTNSNSTPLGSRSNPSQANLFNATRQDLIGTLLNNYTYPNFPSNNPNLSQFNQSQVGQMQPQNSGGQVPHQQQLQQQQSQAQGQNTFSNYYLKDAPPNADVRPRGDSIYLPPPVNSQFRFSTSEDPAGSGQSQQQQQLQQQLQQQQQVPNLPSRSNSIFNSLIQFPSNNNSVSENKRPRQVSMNENNVNASNLISLQNFENYLNSNVGNKESLSNLLAWQQNLPIPNQSRSSLMDRKNSKSSKNSSIDLSNPALWESLNYVNGGSINNGSLSNLLQGLSNGSIDFSNMSNEKRRDSILKFLSDPNNNAQAVPPPQMGMPPGGQLDPNMKQESRNSDTTRTTLREDIFDSRSNHHDNHLQVNNAGHPHNSAHDRKSRSDVGKSTDGPLSPTSSLSSKSEVKYDVPQSPKTSPNFANANGGGAAAIGAQVNPNLNPPLGQVQQAPPVPGQRYFNYQTPSSNSAQYGYPPQPPSNSNQYNNFNMYLRNPSMGRLSQSFQNPQYIPPSYTNFSPQSQPLTNQFQPPQSYPQPQSQQPPITQQASMPPEQSPPKSKADDKRSSSRRSRSSRSSRNKIKMKDAEELPPPIQAKEGEKPKLGATKIDQLMLVIQARDKDNNDLKIRTAPDGSIIGDVKPQNLVGGVEKHKLEEPLEADEELDEDGRRRKRKKLPQCPYCQKYFGQTTQLEVHIRSHIGYKPFECSYCHKRFTQGGNLTTHLRLHTGEKPFTCEICNKSFSRKGNLAAHKLTHDNLKPYDCKLDNCDKSFTQLGNLKSHQNKFHLSTLNELTTKLAELTKDQISELPDHEQKLLHYFKELYKNSNKGIKGRGKRDNNDDSVSRSSSKSNSTSPAGGITGAAAGTGTNTANPLAYNTNGVGYDNYGSGFMNSNNFRNDSYDLNYQT